MISSKKSPDKSDRLPASNPSMETLDLLMIRRSLTVKDMVEPGPNSEQLNQLLTIGSRVPDHKKQTPWRFLTFEGAARGEIGKILTTVFEKNNPHSKETLLEFEENRFMRAPVVIGVISSASADNPKVPEWEQILTVGAVCQNILIAASAMGFAAQWLTEWYSYDDDVKSALHLSSGERIAGFIYIGSTTKEPSERSRPNIKVLHKDWGK